MRARRVDSIIVRGDDRHDQDTTVMEQLTQPIPAETKLSLKNTSVTTPQRQLQHKSQRMSVFVLHHCDTGYVSSDVARMALYKRRAIFARSSSSVQKSSLREKLRTRLKWGEEINADCSACSTTTDCSGTVQSLSLIHI